MKRTIFMSVSAALVTILAGCNKDTPKVESVEVKPAAIELSVGAGS